MRIKSKSCVQWISEIKASLIKEQWCISNAAEPIEDEISSSIRYWKEELEIAEVSSLCNDVLMKFTRIVSDASKLCHWGIICDIQLI